MRTFAACVATVVVIVGMWAGGWAIKTDIESHLETVQEADRP